MKILYIITKANWGGAQRYVYDLATNLPRAQYAPVVAFGVPGRLAELLRDTGIPCRLAPTLGRNISPLDDIRAFSTLVSLIRHERPDIVHLNSSKAAGLGALAARISNLLLSASCQLPARIIVTIHGLPQDEPRGALARITIAAFTWLTCILAHDVICVTEENTERLRSAWFLSRKVRHIPNGIAPFPLASREASRETLRLPVHAIVVGAIAELHRNKGLDVLIRAIALTPGVHACIIGDGEEREHLETLAHELDVTDRVRFVGFVPDARQYLSAFDVFCLPVSPSATNFCIVKKRSIGRVSGFFTCIVFTTVFPGKIDSLITAGES
jgi:glycosyltransferase involved in cell wall biosynthesis